MLRDWGSWDAAFNAVTAELRGKLPRHRLRACDARLRADAGQRHVLGRGRRQHAGAARRPCAGADQRRLRHALRQAHADDGTQGDRVRDRRRRPDDAGRTSTACSDADSSITHVGLIHCETSTGILNPLPEIAAVVARHGKSLIVDAMSSFAAIAIDARTTPFDALIAASGKCRRRPAGHGLRVRPPRALEQCAGRSTSLSPRPPRSVDLHGADDAVALYAADARRRRLQRGARPACAPRADSRPGSRATRRTARRSSPGMSELGFRTFLEARDSGADHRDLPRAGRPALHVQGVLRARPRQGLHPLSGQAHAARDLPRRLHRRDRSRRNAPGSQRGARRAVRKWGSGA